jgi:hypothetical protein
MSVPAATIRPMPGDLERLPAPVSPGAAGAGPAAMAGELLGRVRAELPVASELGEREQVLVSAWLTGLRSARTRRAYAADVVAWLGWLAGRETGALAAGRVYVDLWPPPSSTRERRPPARAACRFTGIARPMT